ncbi:MAG: peptide chain release factor 3, partial [Pseudonocardia sp.]
TDAEGEQALASQSEVEVLRRTDGTYLAVFSNKWRLDIVQRKFPDIMLEALPAGTTPS